MRFRFQFVPGTDDVILRSRENLGQNFSNLFTSGTGLKFHLHTDRLTCFTAQSLADRAAAPTFIGQTRGHPPETVEKPVEEPTDV